MSKRKPAPRGLKFSQASHRYWLDGKPVPGVTTVIGVLDKPAIPRWAAQQVAEYVADNDDAIAHLRAMGRGPMVQALKGIPWETRDKAGVRGNVLHDHTEALLRGEEITVADEDVLVVQSALDFLDDWRIEPVLIEYACASREHRWAGTGDLIARYRNPATGHEGTAYFDWKSGKRLYPEYALQFAPYTHAEFHGLDGDEHKLPSCDAAFGVHIRSDGYDVAPFEHGPHVYAEFLTVRAAFDIAKRVRGDWRQPGSGYMGLPIHPREENAA